MKLMRALKKMVKKKDATSEILAEIRKEIAKHAQLTNEKMNAYLELSQQMIALQQLQIESIMKLNPFEREKIDFSSFQKPPQTLENDNISPESSKNAIAKLPLLLAEKTYNTAHPEYDAVKVRNYPRRIFNAEVGSKNVVYQALLPRVKTKNGISEIPDSSWESILDQTLAEVKEIPHALQTFERIEFIENYIEDLGKRYKAHYMAGWVNMADALFLYWMVRKLKPKTILQTGVCNGLSSAFMMLGLVKNGPDGRLYMIDLPAIFDPNDPAWTVKNRVYGVMIPEGKSSGWLIPDAYRDRCEVHIGDAKELLPQLVNKLESIDLFYHDSDHTYHHMMFEFNEVKRKLTPGGLIVGDDISWNASVWDFADQHGVPSYNYKGAVGVAFF